MTNQGNIKTAPVAPVGRVSDSVSRQGRVEMLGYAALTQPTPLLRARVPFPERSRREGGFTLLELLLAFSLLSMLFLGLFSSFHTAARSWEASNSRMEQSSDRRLISDFLRRQLSQMMVVKIKNDDEQSVYAFEGRADSVRFASPLQPFRDKGGIYLLELAVTSGKKGKALMLRYVPYRPELTWDDSLNDAEPVLLYDGFDSVHFDYLVSAGIDEDSEWEDEWLDQPHYPLLLKLSLRDHKGDYWPELVIDLPQVDDYVTPNTGEPDVNTSPTTPAAAAITNSAENNVPAQ